MKIALTGSQGLIGSKICQELRENFDVISLGRGDDDVYMDLSNFSLDSDKCIGVDVLIHCAGVTDEEISENYNTSIIKNTLGLVQLVDWAKKQDVKQFIYISSAHVYGDMNKSIDERTEVDPKSLYANLHVFAENYIYSIFKDSLIIRLNAVYGSPPSGFKRNELIPFSFPCELALKKKLVIRSHGMQSRNFISTNTIAKFVSIAILKRQVGIVNLVGYHTLSIFEFSHFCIQEIYKKYDCKLSVKALVEVDGEYVDEFDYKSIKYKCNESENELKIHVLSIFEKFLDK
jgi:UDP-glucose 4-epimerase